MNRHKKLMWGLSFLLLSALSFVFIPSSKAYAEVVSTQKQIEDGRSTLKFVNRATITGTFAKQEVTFIDKDPFDTDYNYRPEAGFFCKKDGGPKGITIRNDAISRDKFGQVASSVPANLDLDYSALGTTGANGCKDTEPNVLPTGIVTDGKAFIAMAWQGPNLVSLPGVEDTMSLSQLSNQAPSLYVSDSDDKCYGSNVVLLDNNNQGVKYKLSNFVIGKPDASANDKLKKYFTESGKCAVDYSFPMAIFGTRGTQAPINNPGSGGSVPGDDTSDCVANSDTGLEWILCPITTSLSKGADGMNKLIESQLNFDVSGNLANKDEGYVAWSLVKNIVSALVVIIMLVMVIAQALGGGPFDAYTIKKLLPKLVIAVIGMQLSWEICKWLINLSNAAGLGIKQLMVAPFGGGGNMDLNSILSRLDETWALGSQAILPTLLVGGVIVTAIALPGALVTAFGLFIGIFAALMVLLFRNVLIVALTIFAPLAFLAWTLPGTQSYWKLWKDNFTKLLLMFPLIVAMIYVGRIFAWLVADAGAPGFIDYMTILVAYFGPYFMIFKSYKWGGSIMSAAGTGIAGARRGLTQANSPWLKVMGERAQGNLADRYEIVSRDLREKIAQGTATKEDYRKARFRRAMYRVGAGKPLPTERQQVETLAKANQYKKELVDLKHGLIHSDYVEALNSGMTVQQAKTHIRNKYGYDNMVEDENGNLKAKDKYTERAFYNWLVDTKSAMELGDENWRKGSMKLSDGRTVYYGGRDEAGNAIYLDHERGDIAKTQGFIGMMNADTNRYGYIAQNLPILQPFNQALAGGPKRQDFFAGGRYFDDVIKNNPQLEGTLRAGGPRANHVADVLAEDYRFQKWLDNMEDPTQLRAVRPEMYDMMNHVKVQLEQAGIKSRSAATLDGLIGELAASSEGKFILRPMLGGPKSARAYLNQMYGEGYLERKLGVPGGGAAVQQAGGVQSDLPHEDDLSDEPKRRAFKQTVLANGGRNPTAQELAQAIAEMPGYAVAAHGTNQGVYRQVLNELRDSAAGDPAAAGAYNEIVDRLLDRLGGRVERAVRTAVAQGKSPQEVSRIRSEAEAAARREMAQYPKLPAGGQGPTIIIPHQRP